MLGFVDFGKDMVYICVYPHLHWFIQLILWVGIFAPFARIYTCKYLGKFEPKRTLIIYFGMECVSCFKIEEYNLLHKLEVTCWVAIWENLIQMFCFFFDFFE